MKTTYEAYGGETIEHACKSAVEQAIKHKTDVTFDFNGVKMLATAQSDPGKMALNFMDELQRSHEEYKASPEGIAAAEKTKQEVKKHQAIVDELIAEAGECVSLDDWMQWLKEFAVSADFIGVNFSHGDVIANLERAGFKNGCHVGQNPEYFDTRERIGHYIAGQAIECLSKGMPPHPVTITFVEKYFKLP